MLTKSKIIHSVVVTGTKATWSTAKRLAVMLFLTVGWETAAIADDACSTAALHTYADVTASDGKTYSVETFYRSKDRAASKFIRGDGGSLHVVEGPFTWTQVGDKAELAKGAQDVFQRDFALGHQFHALMVNFHDIVSDIEPVSDVEFAGGKASALKGMRDTGGAVYLIDGETPGRPAGMRYDVGDLKIDIIASDWQEVDGTALPFGLLIDDGSRTFDYQFRSVDMSGKPLMWYYGQVPSPAIDEIDILRLHKKSLIAHCIGDAEMMAGLSAPSPIIANSGSIFDTSPEQTQAVFTNVFGRRKYSNYIATRYPTIDVSAAGDVGWAAVQVNAKGMTEATGQPFDEHWAWFMLAKKIDGQWRMAGNASNRQP